MYQWSQTLSDVDIFAPLPPGQPIKAKMLYVDFNRNSLSFGIVGTDPYMKVLPAAPAQGHCKHTENAPGSAPE